MFVVDVWTLRRAVELQAVGWQAGVFVGHGDEAGPGVGGVAQERVALPIGQGRVVRGRHCHRGSEGDHDGSCDGDQRGERGESAGHQPSS